MLLAYGIVFVLAPVVLISESTDGGSRDATMTAYFVGLAGLLVVYNWRLDRGRSTLYAELVTASQRVGSASLMPNPTRQRRFLRTRVTLTAGLCLLAAASPRFRTLAEVLVPSVVALAAISAVSWHAKVPGLVASREGLATRRHGLIPWSQIVALPIVKSGDARFLQIWVCDRVELALRALPARPRVARRIAAFVQRREAPLAGVYEPFVLRDLDEYQRELEILAGRSLRDVPATG